MGRRTHLFDLFECRPYVIWHLSNAANVIRITPPTLSEAQNPLQLQFSACFLRPVSFDRGISDQNLNKGGLQWGRGGVPGYFINREIIADMCAPFS